MELSDEPWLLSEVMARCRRKQGELLDAVLQRLDCPVGEEFVIWLLDSFVGRQEMIPSLLKFLTMRNLLTEQFISKQLEIVPFRTSRSVGIASILLSSEVALSPDHFSNIFDLINNGIDDCKTKCELRELCFQRVLEGIGLSKTLEGPLKDGVLRGLLENKNSVDAAFVLWVFKSTIKDQRMEKTPFEEVVKQAKGHVSKELVLEMLEFARENMVSRQGGGGNFLPILKFYGKSFDAELLSELLAIVKTNFRDSYKAEFLQNLLENDLISFNSGHILQIREIADTISDPPQKMKVLKFCEERFPLKRT